jgi:hypothetical protein
MHTMMPEQFAAHLRSEIGRLRLTKYLLAAVARINPIQLSRFLNERDPIPPHVMGRIVAAIAQLEKEQQRNEK